MNSAFMHCSRTHKYHFLSTFSLKMGPTILFTHLKIISLQRFSVFNFSFQFSAVSKRTLILFFNWINIRIKIKCLKINGQHVNAKLCCCCYCCCIEAVILWCWLFWLFADSIFFTKLYCSILNGSSLPLMSHTPKPLHCPKPKRTCFNLVSLKRSAHFETMDLKCCGILFSITQI